MNKIKLRQFLRLTEQAPQPPAPLPSAPGTNDAGLESPDNGQPTPPTAPDTSPTPEDPGEYDFTKDFRAFEDTKNKVESEEKKKLVDKMNEKLLGKTIVANASRGYGQPKTDYTIKSVKKVSVEFWYKDYVVIISDENEKKYFLTPGINIKIEAGETPQSPEEQPQGMNAGEAGGEEESPNGQPSAIAPAGGGTPNNVHQQPQQGTEQEPQGKTPPAIPQAPTSPQKPQVPGQPPEEPSEENPQLDIKKKKKVVPPVAEWVQKDLNQCLLEFMVDGLKKNGKVNFIPYIKNASEILTENKNLTKVKCKLVIPENHMKNVDNREIRLSATDVMRQRNRNGQYSNGSINIDKNGRYYLLEYIKEVGFNKIN